MYAVEVSLYDWFLWFSPSGQLRTPWLLAHSAQVGWRRESEREKCKNLWMRQRQLTW